MTPCEKRGYKIRDRFRVTKGSIGFGEVVELCKDDGSPFPEFKLIKGDLTFFKYLGNVEKIMTNSIQDRIRKAREELEAAEREYAEQQRKDEKWEPKGGPWWINDFGKVLKDSTSTHSSRIVGVERESEDLAKRAALARTIHDRMLAYVHEHAPDYEFDEDDAWMVEEDDYGKWEIEDASYRPVGAVIGPRWVMQKLADDLRSGRVTLLPEGYE